MGDGEGRLGQDIVDLTAHGRRLTRVLVEGIVPVAVITPLHPDWNNAIAGEEAGDLLDIGFRPNGEGAFVALGSRSAEAGLFRVYRWAKAVDIEGTRHEADAMPPARRDDDPDRTRHATARIVLTLLGQRLDRAAREASAAVQRDLPSERLAEACETASETAAAMRALADAARRMPAPPPASLPWDASRLGLPLTTGRLAIREARSDDRRAMSEAVRSRRVIEGLVSLPSEVRSLKRDHGRILDGLVAVACRDGTGTLVITGGADGRFIGALSLSPPYGGAVEVGVWLADGETGMGHATEAVEAVSARLLGEGLVEAVDLRVMAGNPAARRMAEALGYEAFEGGPPLHGPDGKPLRTLAYRLDLPAYEARRGPTP